MPSAAGLRPDPVGELERSRDLLAAARGKGRKGGGRERRKEERGVERKRGMEREKWKYRNLPPPTSVVRFTLLYTLCGPRRDHPQRSRPKA